MEKRVLLAVVLSFIVLYGFQLMYPPPEPQTRPVANQPASAPATAAPAPVEKPREGTAPAAAAQPSATPVVHDDRDREIRFENAQVSAVFSSRGAAVRHWRLKNYLGEDGNPLDLVPAMAPPGSPGPFTLAVGDDAVDATLAQALFKPSADSIDATAAEQRLVFEYVDAAGLAARKEFTFRPDQPFVIGFSASPGAASRSTPR
jgi:YidC/Oxa1 family membrane protein insertase